MATEEYEDYNDLRTVVKESWWQKLPAKYKQMIVLITVGIIVFIAAGYFVPWMRWTGFQQNDQPYRTLWDWMTLLAFPLSVLLLGLIAQRFQSEQRRLQREEQAAREKLKQQEEKAREERQQQEYQQRFEKEALTSYYAAMSNISVGYELRSKLLQREDDLEAPSKSLPSVARAHTLGILDKVDKKRREEIIDFLRDSRMLSGEMSILLSAYIRDLDLPAQRLGNVNFSGTHLSSINLHRAYLQNANFICTHMISVDLSNANMQYADLRGAFSFLLKLNSADLQNANLSCVDFNDSDMRGTNLKLANLNGANLMSVHLGGANLWQANLDGAILAYEHFNGKIYSPKFDEETTLPDGVKYDSKQGLEQFARFGAIVEPITYNKMRRKQSEILTEMGIDVPKWLQPNPRLDD